MEQTPFDKIKKVTEYGADYWLARELMVSLGYDTWRRFEDAIQRAIESCNTSGGDSSQEFLPAPAKTLELGGRPGKDYILSRYACYLIAEKIITEKKEVEEIYNSLPEVKRQEIEKRDSK